LQTPAAADDWQQAVAVLVGHPEPHRTVMPARQLQQFGGKVVFEGLGLGRVFFGVGFARHFQNLAGFFLASNTPS
jgi:hypothetical protein